MKAITEQIKLQPNESFRLLRWSDNVRDVEAIDTDGRVHPFKGTGDVWHAHTEMELVLITHGAGTRYLGDSIKAFKAIDLVLVGSNLPHHWHSRHFSGYAIQFNPGSPHPLGQIPETRGLRPLWQEAQHGIQFTGPVADEVAALLTAISSRTGVGRFALLMMIMDKLAAATRKNKRLISRKTFLPPSSEADYRGIQKAIYLVFNRFHEELQFADILKQAGMSKATFARQFRKHTGKTLTQFITDVRLDHAGRQLIETDRTISEIAFASGFNNLSHFNRQFNLAHNLSPRAYRNKMKKSSGLA